MLSCGVVDGSSGGGLPGSSGGGGGGNNNHRKLSRAASWKVRGDSSSSSLSGKQQQQQSPVATGVSNTAVVSAAAGPGSSAGHWRSTTPLHTSQHQQPQQSPLHNTNNVSEWVSSSGVTSSASTVPPNNGQCLSYILVCRTSSYFLSCHGGW